MSSFKIKYPDLPVSERREEIAHAIQNNQVVVIAGETGSGKTTQLPKICLELGLAENGLIGHTQPRRLAARTVAARIAEELESELGQLVGYQVRFHDQVSQASKIKLMTDGILLAETQHDRLLKKYSVLIIDEAHERSLNIDFLLGYLSQILPKRPDLKLIITSATIDLERFSQHFNNAPIIEVSGRTFPVEMLYRPLHELEEEDEKEQDLQQGILTAVDELVAIDRQKRSGGPGDILVFLPGEREIRETAESLRKAELRDTEIIPLYARLSLAEQNRVFHDQRRAGRRIVLATNVAETSLTVPGIRYVIDPGVARISRYSYRSKVQRLPIEAISQASANQRAGRCGRVAPGVCIRLYSEEDFKSRPAFTDAEIRRTNLAAVILSMLQLKLGDISLFPFIDPPDSRFINDGFKLLEELKAVGDKRHMTRIGRDLARLPVDPRIGRMLLEGAKLGALREVMIIASALSVQDPRERPHDKRQAADEKHKLFADDDSDFMTLLKLWELYEEQRQTLSQGQLRKWCQKHFISWVRMREWRDLHRQLLLSCRELGYRESGASNAGSESKGSGGAVAGNAGSSAAVESADYASIHRSLLAGLLSHIGFKQEKGEYLGARNRRFWIFPGSNLFKKNPKWIMAAEMLETSRLYAHQVAKIEPQWIEQPASHLVKKSWMEPHWEQKRAQVVATEQVTLYGLIIVPRRKVHYGSIDPIASHEIFIRSALVEGEYTTRAAFFAHNRALLESVEGLEAKSRRRDLLVDEEVLYQFYAEKLDALGGAKIVNGQGFEHWRKEVEKSDPKALFMTEDDILQRSAGHITQQAYPDHLLIGDARYQLNYHFEPGAENDGVTIDVPLALLSALSVQRLDWLVPGMLADKVTALLRGLPKAIRKHFVPVPNYVEAFCDAVSFAQGDLFEALSHKLLRMTGTRVDVATLKQIELDDHYLFNIRVLDEKGKLLGAGRDWEVLVRRFARRAEQVLQSSPSDTWGRKGLVAWDFSELPQSIRLKQAGGVEVEVYPALVDRGTSVDLQVFARQSEAQQHNIRGVARLYLLGARDQARFAQRKMPHLNDAVMLSNKLFDRKTLEDEVLLAAVMHCAGLHDSLPRDAAAFKARFDKVKGELYGAAERVAAFACNCHRTWHQINKLLNGRVSLETVPVLNDIKAQLTRLFTRHYLTETSPEWLEQYPRYLQAILIRLEKYQRELRQNCVQSEELQQWWAQYEKRFEQAKVAGDVPARLIEFRWLLEEYRVSLFAQQLGTRQSVSAKRLRKQLEEC
ncbi:ATP-dependent RNA helicase HrpA [Nitrincola alkalilacustris]|uniref:ATP-dependent RNA helicase HrpA n=1 Tax=Nitrincola alkalilacustris TaxID=1571224 RepID=UPI001F0E361F|nr:ATP-dependent RNA helicase HrpA [Nitrincola alkalilacustris]